MGQAKNRGTFEERREAAIEKRITDNVNRQQSDKDLIVNYAVESLEAVAEFGVIAKPRAIRAIKRAADADLMESVKALFEERNQKDGEVVEKNGVVMASGIGREVSAGLIKEISKGAKP